MRKRKTRVLRDNRVCLTRRSRLKWFTSYWIDNVYYYIVIRPHKNTKTNPVCGTQTHDVIAEDWKNRTHIDMGLTKNKLSMIRVMKEQPMQQF